jgi:hypothetical protein
MTWVYHVFKPLISTYSQPDRFHSLHLYNTVFLSSALNGHRHVTCFFLRSMQEHQSKHNHKPRVGRGRGNRSVFSCIFLALELLEIQ